MRGSEVLLHVKATVDVEEHHRRQILLDWPDDCYCAARNLVMRIIQISRPPSLPGGRLDDIPGQARDQMTLRLAAVRLVR